MRHAKGSYEGGDARPAVGFALVRAVAALALLAGAGVTYAAGPRWVSGPPYFTGPSGVPVRWYTETPLYFTDPGDLSATVNHAQADALVAAAAGVWNVPTAQIVLAQGGTLAEHVSGADAYLGNNGPVFPPDVQSSNAGVMQIAVIYDSDGSVTDLLLGGGASSPAECRSNGVTESVDGFNSFYNVIVHAVVVLNGRCTGPAPEQQLQMQYQLERAFGRVLGLGWSQTNDNVFTRATVPTYNQAMHWPILHPIDIVCGAYTYQCLPQAFTLRDDDVASISSLYPMLVYYNFPTQPPAPGKAWSYLQASQVNGTVTFPTGQGMQGVNVILQRQQGGWNVPEAWDDVSAVSGMQYVQNVGNPVTGVEPGLAGSMGSADPTLEGAYALSWVPDIDPAGAQNGPMQAVVSTEAINPLYTGAHAVGPYIMGAVEPSGAAGSQLTQNPLVPFLYPWETVGVSFAPQDAASNCSTGLDGSEASPAPVPASGWWSDVLCAHGHAAWSSLTMEAGRTATIEVTAVDEAGLTTTAKAMPLLGVWAAGDAMGQLPTVAATASAFNTVSLGMTATGLSTSGGNGPQGFRFAIADARGDGRPDFAYRARLLYADAVAPAVLSASGGVITLSGSGFRAGNTVLVDGVAAVVTSWTANSIVAIAPVESAFAARPAGPVDVAVVDRATGGSTVMSGALTYSAALVPDALVLVSAPAGAAGVGTAAAAPFAVRVLLGDGITPAVGLPVTLAASGAATLLGACGAAVCVVTTDANGLASTTAMPMTFGAVTLQATAVGASVTASFIAVTRSVAMLQAAEYVAAGASVAWSPQVSVVQNGAAAAGVAVNWTGAAGIALSANASTTDALGLAQMAATLEPLAAGEVVSGQACAWAAAPPSVCASMSVVGVDPAAMRLAVVSGAGQVVAIAGTFAPVIVQVTDGAGHPVVGAPVTIYQTANAAEMPCPARGACPIAPALESSVVAAVSDGNGQVSVTPLQVAGVGEVTNIAVAGGTQGFVALAISQGP